MSEVSQTKTKKPEVGLFATCLVDLFRPSVGFAAIKLLENAGCTVHVPMAQTCCGQPAYNSGDRADTSAIARQVIETFEGFDYVVAPSGSCASTLKKHYPDLFQNDSQWRERAEAFAGTVHELMSFLTDIMHVERINETTQGVVTYHDSCSGLRELGIRDQPRALLRSMPGIQLREMKDPDVCCGFGGTFCVKYSDISNVIVTRKTANIEAARADMLLAGDLGCLMNMAGKLRREGAKTQARHVAEVLAGMTDTPPIAGTSSQDQD